jgi:perosamine synthetase
MTATITADPGRVGEMSIPFARTVIAPEARAAVDRVLTSGWVTTGPEVAAFEREFATEVGARFAVAVSSCTDAIQLSLAALHLEPGSLVLVPTMTFCGVVNAILHAGLRPALVDVDPVTQLATPATVREACARVGGADAMVVLHFAGQPADVNSLAHAAGLPSSRVVEDAAHGPGVWVGDRPVGAISAATCFSFYATKNLPIGEGGMVTTDDPEIAGSVLVGRLHGMSRDAWRRYLPGAPWRYAVEVDGLKANMTDIQAAIGREQLRHLPEWQVRRAELAARYDRHLGDVPGLRVPPRPDEGRHSWHLYIVRVGESFGLRRDAVIERLSQAGIGTSVHFIPVHEHAFYRRVTVGRSGGFPGADEAFSRILSLPLYPSLEDDDIDRVCSSIAEIQGGGH